MIHIPEALNKTSHNKSQWEAGKRIHSAKVSKRIRKLEISFGKPRIKKKNSSQKRLALGYWKGLEVFGIV